MCLSNADGGQRLALSPHNIQRTEAPLHQEWTEAILRRLCHKMPHVAIVSGLSVYFALGWQRSEALIACTLLLLVAEWVRAGLSIKGLWRRAFIEAVDDVEHSTRAAASTGRSLGVVTSFVRSAFYQ